MKISEIMSRDVETVAPETRLVDAAKKMRQRDCGCVIVVKDDRLVGVVTDRDIAVRALAKSCDPMEMTAEQVMSAHVLYCRETDDAADVARNMGENKVRRLPVLDARKRMVGIVSLGDLAAHSNPEICGEALGIICKSSWYLCLSRPYFK